MPESFSGVLAAAVWMAASSFVEPVVVAAIVKELEGRGEENGMEWNGVGVKEELEVYQEPSLKQSCCCRDGTMRRRILFPWRFRRRKKTEVEIGRSWENSKAGSKRRRG